MYKRWLVVAAASALAALIGCSITEAWVASPTPSLACSAQLGDTKLGQRSSPLPWQHVNRGMSRHRRGNLCLYNDNGTHQVAESNHSRSRSNAASRHDGRHEQSTDMSPPLLRRRQLLTDMAAAGSGCAGIFFGPTLLAALPQPAAATGFFDDGSSNRRQLELCIVVILRILYWAQRQADALHDLSSSSSGSSESTTESILELEQERRRKAYLDTRLGAKAILTGKIGPGATGTTYTLATLQLPACLNDLEWHAATASRDGSSGSGSSSNALLARRVSDWRRDLVEALASIVEFDGLETLIDPSPRSSLTLSQYTVSKAIFVRRVLQELVLPPGRQLVSAFGPEALQRSLAYTQQYYSNEIRVSSASTVSKIS